MKDYWTHLEALRKPAAESALISALAIDPQKRELFAKHAAHISALAAEVEHAMAANKVEPPFRDNPVADRRGTLQSPRDHQPVSAGRLHARH
jgi:hypothetical protein